MLAANFQSGWESQRARQPKPKNGVALNFQSTYEENEKEKAGSSGLSLFDSTTPNRNLNPHSSSSINSLNSTVMPRLGNNNGGYSELPNLKLPQNTLPTRYASSSIASNSTYTTDANTLIGNSNVPSPRSTGLNRDVLAVHRKYRVSSRQTSHGQRNSSNKRQIKSGDYGSNYASAESYVAPPTVKATTTNAPSEVSFFPQIPSSTNSALSSANNNSILMNPNLMPKRLNQFPTNTSLMPVAATPQPMSNKDLVASFTGLGSSSTGNAGLNGVNSEEHEYGAVTSIKGLKPGNPNWINQDSFFVVENSEISRAKLYCVLDGHGENGHLVARRCRENFPHFIKSSNGLMEQAFNMIQNDLTSSEIDVRCSGATCVLASIANGRLTVYNCGDSRAVMGRRSANGSITAQPMSNDHKPDKPEERKRILGCGGHLGCRQVLVNQGARGPVSMPVGPCRVWYQHRGETLGLAMSRSLGDAIVHKLGVSAEPEALEHVIDDHDEFVILATDGVWDVIDNNHAVQMVHNFVLRSADWSPLEASLCICKFARSRWEKLSPMIDDITCVIVKLRQS